MPSYQKQVRVGERLELLDAPKGSYEIVLESLGAPGQTELQVTRSRVQIAHPQSQPELMLTGSRYVLPSNLPSALSVTRAAGLSFVPSSDTLISFTTTAADPFDLGDKSSRAWNAGKVDKLTNLSWNEAVVGPGEQMGLAITEQIGGDDVTDWVKFRVTGKLTQIQLDTNGAIAELVKGKSVVVGSSDAYDSSLTATLTRGTYYLHFSSESSMSEAFTSRLSLT